MLPLLPVLLILVWRGCASGPPTSAPVNCYVVNLNYVNCSWKQPEAQTFNYSFFSGWCDATYTPRDECSEYVLGEGGVAVGCRIPYKETQRFSPFQTSLRGPGGLSINQQHDFNDEEKLRMTPPDKLDVRWIDKDLVLSWDLKYGTNEKTCIHSRVQYGLNDKWQTPVEPIPGSKNFTVPRPSKSSRHKFRVQVRFQSCGSSPWSEWSHLVEWGNRTAKPTPAPPPFVTNMSVMLSLLLAAVFLLLLTCLLVHCERLRVTFIPVVPTPGKNLTELIDTYNGNVEKWLCISKELQEGFKPSFLEHPYTAREYRLVGQSSMESDSGVSLCDSPSISSSCSSSSTSQSSDGSC